MSTKISRSKLLFALAFLLAVCAQGFLVLSPILQRDMPVELDDALVYEVKAAQMESCFWQDCPGLVSLKEQLELGESEFVGWPKFRMARSFLHIYHPGHSLILVALHKTGLSWEAAFDLTRVAGSVFIVGSIAFWAYMFFGRATATVFLVFLAATLFPEQGIHLVTPGNLSMGVTFLMLGLILKKGRYVEPALVAGSAMILSLHTIAILLAPLVWGFYFFHRGWPLHRLAIIGASLSAVLVVLSFAAQKLVSTPMFHLPVSYRPDDTGLVDQIVQNAQVAKSTVIGWFLRFGFGRYVIIPVALFCLWGFSRLDAEKRNAVLIFGALLSVILVGGLAMVFPAHPGLLFYRLWIFASALGLGLFAHALLDLSCRGLSLIRSRNTAERVLLSTNVLTRPLPTFGALAICIVLSIFYIVAGSGTIAREAEVRKTRHEYHLSREQVRQLLSLAKPESLVYYFSLESSSFSSREPMLFYFTHGAMHLYAHTDFIPAEEGAETTATADYAAGWNPLMSLPNGQRHGLVLKPGDVVEIETGQAVPANAIELNLDRVPAETEIHLEVVQSNSNSIETSWHAANGWSRPFPQSREPVSLLRITSSAPVDLTGVKLDVAAKSKWPWGKDRSFTLRIADDKSHTVSADVSNLEALRKLQAGCTASVLDDTGAFVLLQLSGCPDK